MLFLVVVKFSDAHRTAPIRSVAFRCRSVFSYLLLLFCTINSARWPFTSIDAVTTTHSTKSDGIFKNKLN